MENKKSNIGWIILTIVLLLIIGGLTFIVLKDKGIIKIGNTTKKETKVEEKTTKKESKKEEISEKQIIRAPEKYNEGENELGKIKVGKNEYEIKVVINSSENSFTTFIGNKKIEGFTLYYATVMGEKFLVVKGNSGYTVNQKLYVFDETLKEAVEPSLTIVNSFGVINDDGTTSDSTPTVTGKTNSTKEIIDSDHLIIAECTPARNSANHNQDYVEKLYSFENGKVEIEELTVVENIFCSAQR